jgi:hypothetical protein
MEDLRRGSGNRRQALGKVRPTLGDGGPALETLGHTFIRLNVVLPSLHSVQKERCGQEVGATARRHIQIQETTLELIQPAFAQRRSASTTGLDCDSALLGSGERRRSTPVQHTGIVQTRHDAE